LAFVLNGVGVYNCAQRPGPSWCASAVRYQCPSTRAAGRIMRMAQRPHPFLMRERAPTPVPTSPRGRSRGPLGVRQNIQEQELEVELEEMTVCRGTFAPNLGL
jgi:hypothetical protein